MCFHLIRSDVLNILEPSLPFVVLESFPYSIETTAPANHCKTRGKIEESRAHSTKYLSYIHMSQRHASTYSQLQTSGKP